MIGVVLALAGLTCGDGGPEPGAVTAPVAVSVSFDGVWEVTDHKEPGPKMALFEGALWPRGVVGRSPGFVWKMQAKGGGVLRVWDGRRELRGEWQLRRDGILITIKEADISWTVRPHNSWNVRRRIP